MQRRLYLRGFRRTALVLALDLAFPPTRPRQAGQKETSLTPHLGQLAI